MHLPTDEMWDDMLAPFDQDPDELKPTLRVVPQPRMTYDEQVERDRRRLETQLAYGTLEVAA